MISVNIVTMCVIYMFYYKFDHIETYTFEPPNLRSVLFKDTDLLDRCWSTHEVNLLLNRKVLQDIVPRKIPRNLPLLLKYLNNIEETALNTTLGLNQTLLLMAIGDVIGGYLQAIVIPIANEAYYAGNVDYNTMIKLHEMLDRWKQYLSTDGGSWSQECDMHKITTKVSTLNISMHDPESACQELYVSDTHSNETDYVSSELVISEVSRIPIPYLDNNAVPNAIALPFRKRNLLSLSDPKSAYILVKYYSLSMRCLSGNPSSTLAFNNHFHVWIVNKVVPRLHDQDRWYPAFGAVMQVIETIKQKSLASDNPVFIQPVTNEPENPDLNANINIAGPSIKHSGKVANYFHIINNPYALLILFGIMFLVMSIICCLCICCCLWLQKKKNKPLLFLGDSDDTILKNMIISLYCSLKNSLTDSSGSIQNYETQHQENDEPHPAMHFGRATQSYISNPYSSPVDSSDVTYSGSSNSEEEYSGSSKDNV